jgi:hypothetical protein
MAVAHVDSLLGINAIWATIAAPAAKMKPATGMTLILASAAALAASMPLARVLVEAPWLHLPFVAAAVAGSTYLLSDAQLADGWRQVQLFFVNTFWIVIFDPEGFGWSVGYNFGAALVAFGLIVLFDNVLWPDPSESELLCSLEASLKSIRVRFILIGRDYLSPSGSIALPQPSTIGAMGNHLTLLARSEREGISRGRYAVLLSAVSSTERLRLEVERMLAIARERVPRGIRQLVQPELQRALVAIDSGLQTGAADLAAGLTEERGSYDISRPVASALEAYSRREIELHAQFLISRADELSNLSAFVDCLHRHSRYHSPVLPSGPSAFAHIRHDMRDPSFVRWACQAGCRRRTGRISSNICAPHDRFASFEANPFNSAESDGNTLDQSRAKTLPRKAFDLDDESELRK